MTLLVPDAGEVAMAAAALGKTNMTALTLRLYSNNYTPTEASVAADFTEVAGGGYAAIALVAANWTVATAAGVTTAVQPEQIFNFTGDATDPYGYYITRADGTVLWAERFSDGPYPITTAGDQVKITPQITFD
jgi:hypothetical protein